MTAYNRTDYPESVKATVSKQKRKEQLRKIREKRK